MPRCARLLKLKLQGKAPFLGCNTSSVTFQNFVYETYERCCTILCPPVEAPMPPHAIGYPFRKPQQLCEPCNDGAGGAVGTHGPAKTVAVRKFSVGQGANCMFSTLCRISLI